MRCLSNRSVGHSQAGRSAMNFSLRALLLAVPVIAVGISGYVFQLQWATSLSYTICVAMLLFAAVGAVFGRQHRRLFWAGFAVLGWGYWYMAFEKSPSHSWTMYDSSQGISYRGLPGSAPPTKLPTEYHFVTADILDFVERYVTPSKRVGSRIMGEWSSNTYYSATIAARDGANYLVKWDDGSTPTWLPETRI